MKSITPVTADLINDDEAMHLIPPTTNNDNAGRMNATDKDNLMSPPPTTVATPTLGEYVVDAHPPNTPPGGRWGKQHFRGRLTAAATVGGVLVACIPGLLVLFFRLDERDAYLAKDGQLYNVEGKCLGDVKKLKFVPDRPRVGAGPIRRQLLLTPRSYQVNQ